MDEVYYSVSKNGVFLFRTDKMNVGREAAELETELLRAFQFGKGYTITVYSRNPIWQTVTLR